MPNLTGRKDHEREKERNGSDCETELVEEFDFGSVEEAEGGSAEEAESVHGRSNRREESKSANQGGDEAKKSKKEKTWLDVVKGKKVKTKTWSDVVKGLKIEDKLETTNSDKSGDESETSGSIRRRSIN